MNDMTPRFGPAGISDSFAAQGYKTSLDIPAYTAGMGLEDRKSTRLNSSHTS